MSTQPPMPITPKRMRNIRSNGKQNTVSNTQGNALLTTPPASPWRNLSPMGTTANSISNTNTSKRKKVRGGKKRQDTLEASPAYSNERRYSSSQPKSITTPRLKDSPHYAGPTFHASPAPSALPIPSFLSKSVPDSELEPSFELEDDGFEVEPDLAATPSKLKPRSSNSEETSTPLDFLFKAAVEARKSKLQRSPQRESEIRYPHTDSRTVSQSHPSYSAATHGIFALEMDNHEYHKVQIGPSLATSYKQRMNALRSASSPAQPTVLCPTTELDEAVERKAKTEALKRLLLEQQPPQPPSLLGNATRSSTPPSVPHFATPPRTISDPRTTGPHIPTQGQKKLVAGNVARPLFSPKQLSQTQRSALRREVASPNAPGILNILNDGYSQSDSYDQSSPKSYQGLEPGHRYATSPRHQPMMEHVFSVNQPPQIRDTKKMEDDLRRILKLDNVPNSVQSSYA